MHQSYEHLLEHPADFRVAYRFYDENEGGRKKLPYQGYRSDFWYDYEGHDVIRKVYMIWPEFENIEGELILEDDGPVSQTGTARMWILIPTTRRYHQDKISVGLKCYFMEGSRKVAECSVIEIVGLKENPIEDVID